jgi:hypothetical protein
MPQRAVPADPPYEGSYVISTVRAPTPSMVTFEVVTDQLQRLYVTMPSARTDADQIEATIQHALAGLYRPPDPIY